LCRAAGRLARRVPPRWEEGLLTVVSTVAFAVMARRRRMVARHLQRVAGRPLRGSERRRVVRASFRSYARYWLDTFRLAGLDHDELDGAGAGGSGPLTLVASIRWVSSGVAGFAVREATEAAMTTQTWFMGSLARTCEKLLASTPLGGIGAAVDSRQEVFSVSHAVV
jgi:hypothetical protein